jgi:regulator of protease activity HflC (stomatin/prohibitin superfamily)
VFICAAFGKIACIFVLNLNFLSMKLNTRIFYIAGGAIAILLLLILGGRMFIVLKPGERGVIFRPYTSGLDKNNIYSEGFHIIAPWNEMYVYNVREQQREETMDVLDKNGLSITMDVTVRFNPLYSKTGFLHEQFGIDFVNVLVVPEVRSSVRQVAGRYTAEEIYSTKRSEVEQSIIFETKKVLDNNFIDMRALLIRSIILPPQIKDAIEVKLKTEQEALAYTFRLDREKSEAERRRIEAEGIANYNRIISASLTDNILKQRGIEATTQLSQSANTKVIVIGSGKDGLPLILGNN